MLTYRSRLTVPAFLVFTLACALGGPARGDFVVNVTESGGDVVAVGSGTIDTAGLSFLGSYYYDSGVHGIGAEADYTLFGSGSGLADLYLGFNAPSNFGPGYIFTATSSSGDLFAGFDQGYLFLPNGYVSGSSLSTNNTWAGQSFASMGLTPGTYVWTAGSGVNADSYTVNIGTRSVPEPSSLMILGTGAVAVLGCARRRRRAA